MPTERLDATDRVNLLISFVPYLIEHSPISVSDIADHFEVTRESVRELIRLLAVSGVPGDSGMYQHQDLFDIDWDALEEHDEVVLWNHVALTSSPRLSQLEAASLATGLQYLAGIANNQSGLDIRSLIAKLSSSSTAPDHIISVESSVAPPAVARLHSALTAHLVVEFEYRTALQSAKRTVDPIRLDLVGQHWYLRGWCHDRQAIRTFRISRMSDVDVTTRACTTLVTPEELPAELFDPSDGLSTVVCTLPADNLHTISDYQPTVTSVSADGIATLEISLSNLEGVVSLYAKSRAQLRIIKPAEALSVLHNWAREAQEYQSH